MPTATALGWTPDISSLPCCLETVWGTTNLLVRSCQPQACTGLTDIAADRFGGNGAAALCPIDTSVFSALAPAKNTTLLYPVISQDNLGPNTYCVFAEPIEPRRTPNSRSI